MRPLGRGGFAEVWEAESLATGRQVALKILTELRADSERGLERFRQEGRLAASLSHPRCVYVFDSGAVGDLPYISMELVPGGTLQERLRAGPLAIGAAVDCVLDMIDGLEEYMRTHRFEKLDDMIGKAVPAFSEWGNLDLNYETVAKIDADKCIGCQLCVVACQDGAHQCVYPSKTEGSHVPFVDEAECVGCNLCQIVCPVQGCITMEPVKNGFAPSTWNEHVDAGKLLRPKKGAH